MIMSLRSMHRAASALLFGLALTAGASGPASAQSVAVVVNGMPILTSEITARAALLKLTGGKPGEARQEMIDEKIKLGEAKRYGITPNAAQVDAAFASIAQRTKMTGDQFAKALSQHGVNPQSLKDRLGAEIVWAQVIRGKFAAKLASEARQTVSGLSQGNSKISNKAVQYTVRQVIFVLPKGASAAQIAQRKSEAIAARGRFPGCDNAVAFGASLRDVAVRDPVVRSSGQLGKDLNDLLDKIKVGGLTEPQQSDEGLEMLALCSRKDIADDSIVEQAAQEQQGGKQAQEQSDKYLAQLRSRAVVETR